MANINTSKINIGEDDLILQDSDLRSRMVASFQASPDNDHYPTEKLVKNSLDAKLNNSQKGANNGLAELDSNGKVPLSQLPTLPDVSTKYDTGDTASTEIADADYVPFYDTSASGRRKILWRNIKAKLKSYFDSFYLTAHQDISGKANSEDLAEVAFSGDYVDLTNKPTIPAVVSGTNDGTNWTSLSIGGVTYLIPSGGSGGGLSNYDLTFSTLTTNTTNISFEANQQCYKRMTMTAGATLNFSIQNKGCNYLRIYNSSASDITIAIGTITYNNTAVNTKIVPDDAITVGAGKYVEIGITADASEADITVSGTLKSLLS